MAQLGNTIVNGNLRVLNDIYAQNIHGTIVDSSSRNVKENIIPMPKERAEEILNVEVVNFDYINGPKDQSGVIAEEVQEIIPEVVVNQIPNPGVDYIKFVPYLIKVVQIQEARIKELEEKVTNLENK